jgi:ribosomal protein L11 methyltransferase
VTWVRLWVDAGSEREAAIRALFGAGVGGIEEDGEAIVTCVRSDDEASAIEIAVMDAAPGARIRRTPVDERDWSTAWREGLTAHTVGRLTITPPWLTPGHDPEHTIVIDPGMAFGTGDHATTRGVVRLMQRVIPPARRVADLGAGSAVLSIAAAKLGATQVFAIEVDPDATENAEANIATNRVAHVVHYFEGDAAALLPLVAPMDVVVANIVTPAILELLPAIEGALAPGGSAIVSGVLISECEDLVRVASARGWRLSDDYREGDWWSGRMERP